MRITSYRFPEEVDPHTRYQNGAEHINGCCDTGRENCKDCPIAPDMKWRECEHFKVTEAEDIIDGVSVTTAKQLLKVFGGSAWTAHYDRDGGLFETTAVELGKNNSRHKYNQHL